jgi:Membrane proteins related to metalloendopeptidases
MVNYLTYLLKVSICIAVFYAFYWLLLRHWTFFLLNRVYLMLGLILSFVLPVIKLSLFQSHSIPGLSNIVIDDWIYPEINFAVTKTASHDSNTISVSNVLTLIYWVGVIFLFFKLLFSIVRIKRLKKGSTIQRLDKVKLIITEVVSPFSFFNLIFLPKNEANALILEHEKAHINQFHWFDLVLVEAVSVLLWFNPFVILYKSALRLQHEYLADNKVVQNNSIEHYLGCILKGIQVVSNGGLVSHFYCKTIKKRIIMITKYKTSLKYSGIYLLVLPLVCLLLFAFSSHGTQASLLLNPQVETTTEANAFVPSIYPIDAKKVTKINVYGERIHPLYKIKNFHYGIDFAISEGEAVTATASGTVIEAKFDKGWGKYILIKHNDEYSTFYSHLKSITIKTGGKVERGQVIGYVGSTGISTGPHLHYEVRKNGNAVNPEEYLPKN